MKLVRRNLQAHDPQSLRFGSNAHQAPRSRQPHCSAWTVARLLMFATVMGGCNDPYSQRRIAMREEHLNQTVTDIVDRERDGVRRVQEADETLKKWWKRDVEDFERRAPTIGDYFW